MNFSIRSRKNFFSGRYLISGRPIRYITAASPRKIYSALSANTSGCANTFWPLYASVITAPMTTAFITTFALHARNSLSRVCFP